MFTVCDVRLLNVSLLNVCLFNVFIECSLFTVCNVCVPHVCFVERVCVCVC